MLSFLGGTLGFKLHQTLGPLTREKISCGLLGLRLSLICEKQNNWLWSEKSPHFIFFQINILFKINVVLLRNLCGNLNKKFVSDQWSGLKEMFQGCISMRCCLDKILSFLVKQVTFPPLSTRLSAVKVWDMIENRAYAAIVHGFSRLRTTF